MDPHSLPVFKEKRIRRDEENDDGDDTSGVDHVDRFSHMPEHIVHHIMTILPIKDATHTSVLSKHFLFIWRSFPTLNFDYRLFSTYTNNATQLRFMDKITTSIENYHLDGDLESLRIRFPLSKLFNGGNNNINFFLSDLLSYALMNSIKKLIVDCTIDYMKFFRPKKRQTPPLLPVEVLWARSIKTMNLCGLTLVSDEDDLIIINCSSLEDLTFEWCTTTAKAARVVVSCPKLRTVKFKDCKDFYIIQVIEDKLESFSFELSLERIQYNCQFDLHCCKYSLKTLSLRNIQVSDEWFASQVSELESLECLKLVNCKTLQTIISTSNNNIERIELINCETVAYIKVLSPKLEYFHYHSSKEFSTMLLQLYLYQCDRLRDVRLEGANITNKWIKDHFNPLWGFRVLENLCLKRCNLLQKVEIHCSRISKQHLKFVELIDCENVSYVEIDAPNLVWFNYGGPLPSTVVVPSINLDAQISVHGDYNNTLDYYQNMRNFLSYFGHCKTLTLVCSHEEDFIFPKEAREGLLSPLCDLKHLKIKFLKEIKLANIVQLIKYLFWLAPSLNTIFIATNKIKSPTFILKFLVSDWCDWVVSCFRLVRLQRWSTAAFSLRLPEGSRLSLVLFYLGFSACATGFDWGVLVRFLFAFFTGRDWRRLVGVIFVSCVGF
ncbi:hypothetical protein CsatB_030510 [Cannabis sativa]